MPPGRVTDAHWRPGSPLHQPTRRCRTGRRFLRQPASKYTGGSVGPFHHDLSGRETRAVAAGCNHRDISPTGQAFQPVAGTTHPRPPPDCNDPTGPSREQGCPDPAMRPLARRSSHSRPGCQAIDLRHWPASAMAAAKRPAFHAPSHRPLTLTAGATPQRKAQAVVVAAAPFPLPFAAPTPVQLVAAGQPARQSRANGDGERRRRIKPQFRVRRGRRRTPPTPAPAGASPPPAKPTRAGSRARAAINAEPAADCSGPGPGTAPGGFAAAPIDVHAAPHRRCHRSPDQRRFCAGSRSSPEFMARSIPLRDYSRAYTCVIRCHKRRQTTAVSVGPVALYFNWQGPASWPILPSSINVLSLREQA